MTCIYVTVSVIFITSCKFNSIFITLITTYTVFESASSQTVKLTRIRLKAVHERPKGIDR